MNALDDLKSLRAQLEKAEQALQGIAGYTSNTQGREAVIHKIAMSYFSDKEYDAWLSTYGEEEKVKP